VSPGPTRTYGATTTSVPLVALALGLLAFQLFVLPLWLLPRDASWAWLLAPLAFANTPLWSLTHESIHGSLLRDRDWNDRLGRALAVGYGAPFALLKAGHLLHHRFSRTPRERTEVYDRAETTWWRRAPGYYVRLIGGLYLAEAVSVLLLFVPRQGWLAIARWSDSPTSVSAQLFETVASRRLPAFRVDAALIIALYAGAFVAYGPHWWMLLAALGARAFMVSVADNAYHYGTELDAPLEAMNLRLPRTLELFILAFNLHGVHHKHPGLAWPDLRAAFVADGGRFDLGWFAALGRQVGGPVPVDRLNWPGATGVDRLKMTGVIEKSAEPDRKDGGAVQGVLDRDDEQRAGLLVPAGEQPAAGERGDDR
jgi:fatty acid desaturase